MSNQTITLIYTDAINNNNKFYTLVLNGDTVTATWGRVGATARSMDYSGGKRKFDSLVRKKQADGYEETKVLNNTNVAKNLDKDNLSTIAKRDMLQSVDKTQLSILESLINKLSNINKHQIIEASKGHITVDDDGLIKTPLGLVTQNTIQEARQILSDLEPLVLQNKTSETKYISLLESYLKLIPRKIPFNRGWHLNFFTSVTSLSQESGFLDQLETSLDLFSKKTPTVNQKISDTPVFNTKIELVTDPKLIAHINNLYENNINKKHVSSKLKITKIYRIINNDIEQRYQKIATKIGNTQQLWHGTRAFNVLSILKNGLIIPKNGGSYHITGRMFGNGVYFSDQSTKALNYSYGYWDGSSHSNSNDNCFMFLADVALGKQYVPSSHRESLPKSGYDSTFAKGKLSGVLNNEMIVYSLEQINLTYLCEFDSK